MSREIRFETRFQVGSPAYVEDHRVFGVLVVAGASHCAMFLMGVREAFGDRPFTLEELFFLQPFTLSEDGARTAQLVFSPPESSGANGFSLVSLKEGGREDDADSWVQHVMGRVRLGPGRRRPRSELDIDARSRQRCRETWAGDDFYRDFWVQGPDAGVSFRWIRQIWEGDGEALGVTDLPPLTEDLDGYQLHPGDHRGVLPGAQVLSRVRITASLPADR